MLFAFSPVTRFLAATGLLPLATSPQSSSHHQGDQLSFTLRQTHAESSTHPGRVVWRDFGGDAASSFGRKETSFTLSTKVLKASRPRSQEAFHVARESATLPGGDSGPQPQTNDRFK